MNNKEKEIFEDLGNFISMYANKNSSLTKENLLYKIGSFLCKIIVQNPNIYSQEIISRILALGNLAMVEGNLDPKILSVFVDEEQKDELEKK